ncbi:MAG: sensor histidine kinase [Maribacter stanieri]
MKKTNSKIFTAELEPFLLRSQFRAALAVAIFCGLIVTIQIVFVALSLRAINLDSDLHGFRLFLLPLLVGTVALAELAYAKSIKTHLCGGRLPRRFAPFVVAFAEALLPSIGIILFYFIFDWSTALQSPPVSGYFIILLITILRMDARICLFVGGIEAVSFLALIMVASGSTSISFSSGIVVLIIIASVIAAGIVKVTRGLVIELIVSHRAKAQAEAVIWQKDRLLAILGHDLRAPLNGISSLSELMASIPEQFTAAEIRAHAGEIQQNSRHLRELLDNLLTWARLRTSQLPVLPDTHSAADLIEPVLTLYELAFAAKPIHLSAQFTGHATTDRELFQTVLRNLLSNALKFTPKGGTVTVVASDEPDGFTLMVSDNGPGLPDEIIHLANETAFVPSTPGTAGEVGSGLGLLLCHELAQHLGGSLKFESSSERGVTALLHLPINPPSESHV